MNKITIENYRGFDIEFDTDAEKFQCIITEDNSKESKSYSAIKKFINEYKKENQDFQPFWVENIPDKGYRKYKNLKIIGIRKDKRLIAETENGEKIQISEYDLNDFMLVNDKNKVHLEALAKLESDYNNYRENYSKSKKEIIGKMTIVNLKDYKKTLE